jgi:cytochrome c-type biogenesis protein
VIAPSVSVGAITADPLGILVSFGAGILSFLSPCVLPLVPGYLSMVSGLSAAELESVGRASVSHASEQPAVALVGALRGGGAGEGGERHAPADHALRSALRARAPGRPPAPLVRGVLLFIAGFTVVFVALGAGASGLGHLLGAHKAALTSLSGAVIVALGAVLLIGSLPSSAWKRLGAGTAGPVGWLVGWLVGEHRFHVRPSALGAWAAPVMGMAFAFAWTPCIGPVLAAVLGLASTRATLGGGVVLLFAYSLGLGVPFLVTGLAFGRLTGVLARARQRLWVVHLVTGGILVAFGALLLAGQLGWLSAEFSDLLNALGLHRLTTS